MVEYGKMHCRWSWFQWILDRPKFTEPEFFLIILETTYAWSVYTEMALRYREFAKGEFRLQPYLLKLAAINRVSICKLRTCSLKLPIETRRWRNIPSDERFCTLCEDQLIGNEFHYLFICKTPTVVQMRSKYIPTYFTKILLQHCNNIPLMNRLSLYVIKTSQLFWDMSATSMSIRDQFVMTTWKIYKNVVNVVNWLIRSVFNFCIYLFVRDCLYLVSCFSIKGLIT